MIICLVNTYILSLITRYNTMPRKVSKYVFLSNLSIQEYPWIKIAGVCTEENSVGGDYSFGLNHSFICLTK